MMSLRFSILKRSNTLLFLGIGGVIAYVILPAIMLFNVKLGNSRVNKVETTTVASTAAVENSGILIGGAIWFFKNYYINQDENQD